MVRRNYQAWSHSPLTAITRDNVGDLELQWMWAMNEGGRNAPSPIAHDGVLYFASFGPVVQALDVRTGDLIWEHEVSVEAGQLASSSRNLAIYQDKIFLATGRRAADRARRAQRRGGLDHPHRRRRPGLPQHQRAGHRRRQGGAGARGLRPVHPRGLLHQRLRRGERRAALALQHGGPFRRARRQHLGQPAGLPARRRRDLDHRQLRSRARPGLLRRGAGKAVGGDQPGHDGARPGALHELDGRPAAGRRGARLALPARSRREPRPRRGLRARAGRPGGSPGGLQRGQARDSLEAGPGDRRVPRPQGDRLPERVRPHRPRDRRRHVPPGHHRRAVRAARAGLSQHRRRQELAPDELSPRLRAAHPPALPDLHGAVGARGRLRAGLGRRGNERASLLRDARHGGPARQARGVRCRDPGGSLEHRAAGARS